MTHDEVDAILAAKEREAGQRGVRRMHTHPCQAGCPVPEFCEDRTCPYPPGDKSLPCTQQSFRPGVVRFADGSGYTFHGRV